MSEAEQRPEILSLRNVSLCFVDVPRKRRRLLGFIDLPPKGEGEADREMEAIRTCWSEDCYDLRDRLQRLGIEPGEEYKHEPAIGWLVEYRAGAPGQEPERDRGLLGPVGDLYSSVATDLATVATVATGVLPSALSGALGVWFQARFGRKIRLKIGDVEAEATSVAEIELLLERAKAHTLPEAAPDRGEGSAVTAPEP
jgi:hypothetical protein